MSDSLTVTDNRTGKHYEFPIKDSTIDATDLRKIKVSDDDFGLMSFDPGLKNTAVCRSAITFIDGEKGILRYRGYPIEELASKSSFLEVSFLLLNGELPSKTELDGWTSEITLHTMLNENIKKLMDAFHYDAHPMGMLISTIAALSSFYPESKNIFDPEVRRKQIVRLIAKMPTIAAFALKHSRGLPYVYPDNELNYTENFLNMVYRPSHGTQYKPDPILAKALDTLFILHADHEQNCSTNAMRAVGSAQSDPYSCAAAAAAALYGPLHGGANEQVLRMLREIGTKEKIPQLIQQVKEGKRKLMGFGHRVYKNFDPRGKIIKNIAEDVFQVTGRNPLIDVALELERIALEDDYFISRKLYPNVDFYSGIIYEAMGFPTSMFPVLFAVGRMPGWLAQWQEMVTDDEQKLVRPRQIYTGHQKRTI
ncbi:MAG: citrate synthase [Thermoplasmata archaeon YP2-bin.285]|uniref:Citrate synthase n=1 Tax=Candidatus Sysuiplasma superficiale TaxID=2823368 RepID=A0A8J7YP09_9ARCH|nr:citrate synthase [Candidatus Sysuiplasma superficiale]